MKLQPSAIIKKLFLQGQIVTVNSEITFEDAENIAIDYDIICEREVKVDVIEELLKEDEEKEEDLVSRPPVIWPAKIYRGLSHSFSMCYGSC